MRRRRHQRPEPKPWKYDWRNPDLVICTRIMVETGFASNTFEKVAVELTPAEYQEIARDSLLHTPAPTWDKDKTYF